jgi:pimeloyl-ACP methyl ester carboxylesterase
MNSLPKSIVFITGAFIGSNCWDEWKNYFESKGYNCIAPCWPYKNGPPEELRNRHPDPEMASNRLGELIDYFELIINTVEEKPILIGHSLGGLIVQLLLQHGFGAAGVAIHSFPPFGICSLRLRFLKTVWEAMSFFTSKRQTYLMPFSTWAYAMTNGMDFERQKELYYMYAIPESKQVIRDTFKQLTKIDFKRSHAPLLLTSGSNDKLISTVLNYCNYKKYSNSDSVTSYKEFKGHPHLVFDRPAREKEADFILRWLQSAG